MVKSLLFSGLLLVRKLISTIDGWLYTADAEIYNLVVKIARQRVISDNVLSDVAGRIYQLIALIMMFRLIFLFLTYVVNPDDILDKTKGYQNIIKKMVIALVLIVVTPWAFEQSRNLQTVILDEGVIEYLVFGQTYGNATSSGYNLMYTVGQLFITPYRCLDNSCNVLESGVNTDDNLCDQNWTSNIAVMNGSGEVYSGASMRCGLGAGEDKEYAKALWNATTPNGSKYDLVALMGLPGNGNSSKQVHYVKWKFPVIGTTLVGVIIGYMLIIMCIDIAVRSIKLSFYELIAPVPIISYIGPKNGKDTMLNKWFNQVLKTYADLFTRLAGLDIAVFFISAMMKNDEIMNSGDVFVELFLILGALTFAKKLPDILKDLGVNFGGGGFSLKKKLEPAGALARPATGLAVGGAAGAIGNYRAARETGRGVFRSLGAGGRGLVSGSVRGTASAMKEKKGMGFNAALAAGGVGGQKIYNKIGTTFGGRTAAKMQTLVGAKTEADKLDNEIKVNETYAGFKKSLKDNADFYKSDLASGTGLARTLPNITRRSDGRFIVNDGSGRFASREEVETYQRNSAINNALSGGVKGIKDYYEDLQHSGTATAAEITAARESYERAQQYVITNAHKLTGAEQVQYIKSQAADFAKTNARYLDGASTDNHASWSDLNGDPTRGFVRASNRANEIRSNPKEGYAQAQANKKWAESGKSGKK